jgi:diguanylate cyclase (GGDEF)-like protein
MLEQRMSVDFGGEAPSRPARRGRLRRTGSVLKAAWNEPDQFDWITIFLRERGQLNTARLIMATVAGTAIMVPLTMLLGERRPTVALLTGQLAGVALTTVMAVYWSRRWPTRRQSQAAVLTGLMCIALWSQAQASAAMAAQVCVAAAITGGYIAFLHNNKMLAFNFAVALTIDSLTTLRLLRETDFSNAVGSFWLVLFVNLSVPIAIRGASRAIWIYATRSSEDPLTGLLNRRAFTEKLLSHLFDRPATDTHLHVLLVDLDDFKRINDTYGHAIGDRLLTAVAEVLRQFINGSGTICRAGGEEFLVAYTRAATDPEPVATQLCTAIGALSPTITASIGVTSAPLRSAVEPVTPDFIEQLVDVADRAMYAAKRDGGNRVRLEPSHPAKTGWSDFRTSAQDLDEQHTNRLPMRRPST